MILTGTAVIFTAAFGYNYIYSRNRILRDVETNVENLTLAAVSRIETVLQGGSEGPLPPCICPEQGEPRSAETPDADRHPARQQSGDLRLRGGLRTFAFDRKTRAFAPYAFRKENSINHISLGNNNYSVRLPGLVPDTEGAGTGGLERTLFRRGGRQHHDVHLFRPFLPGAEREQPVHRHRHGGYLPGLAGEHRLPISPPTSQASPFLISQSGVFVTHPDWEVIMRESIFSVAEAANDPELRETGRAMIHGEKGFVALTITMDVTRIRRREACQTSHDLMDARLTGSCGPAGRTAPKSNSTPLPEAATPGPAVLSTCLASWSDASAAISTLRTKSGSSSRRVRSRRSPSPRANENAARIVLCFWRYYRKERPAMNPIYAALRCAIIATTSCTFVSAKGAESPARNRRVPQSDLRRRRQTRAVDFVGRRDRSPEDEFLSQVSRGFPRVSHFRVHHLHER